MINQLRQLFQILTNAQVVTMVAVINAVITLAPTNASV